MSIFQRVSKKKVCTAAAQTGHTYPYDSLYGFSTVGVCQPELYRALREAIPLIDTAIYKLVRLTGGFTVKSRNGKNQEQLDEFLQNVSGKGNNSGLPQ